MSTTEPIVRPYSLFDPNPQSLDRPLLAKVFALCTGRDLAQLETLVRAKNWRTGYTFQDPREVVRAGSFRLKVDAISGQELLERAIARDLFPLDFVSTPRQWARFGALCTRCGASGHLCPHCKGLGVQPEDLLDAPELHPAIQILSLGPAQFLQFEALAEATCDALRPHFGPTFKRVVWACGALPTPLGRAIWIRPRPGDRRVHLYSDGSLHAVSRPTGLRRTATGDFTPIEQTYPLDRIEPMVALWRLGACIRGISAGGTVLLRVPALYDPPADAGG